MVGLGFPILLLAVMANLSALNARRGTIKQQNYKGGNSERYRRQGAFPS
jgi:hypothetical protein